jgi:hypothetical protein
VVDFEFIQDSFVSCIEASHYVTIPNEEIHQDSFIGRMHGASRFRLIPESPADIDPTCQQPSVPHT